MAHHGVRELMIHLGMLVDAPLRFQAAVHPLDVLLRDEGYLLVAQLRLDVVFDVAAVSASTNLTGWWSSTIRYERPRPQR